MDDELSAQCLFLDLPEQELCHVRQYNALSLESDTCITLPCALVISAACWLCPSTA